MDINPSVTFTWMPFRADGLIVGSVIAVGVHAGVRYEQVRFPLLLTLVAASAFVLPVIWFGMSSSKFSGTLYPAVRVILPCALTLIYGAVLWISLQCNLLSALLGCAMLKPLALYSYGIYVIHNLLTPVFEGLFGPQVLVHWTGGQDAPIYLYFVLSSSVSFLLAMASYHLFEIQFLRLKSNFSISAKPLGTTTAQFVGA
jgi:hypothetical protein